MKRDISDAKMTFGALMDNIRMLYNLSMGKDEESKRVDDIKRYLDEMHESGIITDYIKGNMEDIFENWNKIYGENGEKYLKLLSMINEEVCQMVDEKVKEGNEHFKQTLLR
ncbi:MAG: hypothetical protein LKG11_02850 [Bacilli bacterium]|jgi:hypothetical protein|nr:hypothetical protein [Bacilli bacterium]